MNKSVKRIFFRPIVPISLLGVFFLVVFSFGVRKKILSTPVHAWQYEFEADCAVVLTGGPGRIREGLDLLVRRQINKLIISGVHPAAKLSEVLPQMVLHPDLNPDDIILEKRSQTTFGNAQQSLFVVEAIKCQKVLLVTSRLHMHRAYATFKNTFPPEIEIQAYAVVGNAFHPSFWELSEEIGKILFYSIWAF